MVSKCVLNLWLIHRITESNHTLVEIPCKRGIFYRGPVLCRDGTFEGSNIV